MLLAGLEQHLGPTAALAAALEDPRDPAKIELSLVALLRQRVLQIACGYEDANDADTLRTDPLFKCAVGHAPEGGRALGSQPTFSRRENRITRQELLRTAVVLARFCLAPH